MAAKRLIAGLGCVGFLAFFVVLAMFIRTGAYSEAMRNGSVSVEFFREMWSGKQYRWTLIYSLIAFALAVVDIRGLTMHVQTKNSQEPQPKDYPLGYLAVRARRYFLVFAGLLWVSFYVMWMLERSQTDWLASNAMGVLFYGLFGLSRRPLNKTILQVFEKSTEQAEDVLDAFLEGRAPVRQREQEGRRR